MRATYSPEDNKLRLYPNSRLPDDIYRRVKDAGFTWAPKQELFVAPMWTPEREDLLLELCGELEDEDTSLVERAEQRSDRFRDYSHSRASEADAAHSAVEAICNGIPLGQPILVGHHSERHARRDAERIQNGMRKAISLWDTAQYWKQRAAGALAHAKYLERPDVRARRIKKIEADQRRVQRNKEDAEFALRFWNGQLKLRDSQTNILVPVLITEDNRSTVCRCMGNDSRLHLGVANFEGTDSRWSAWDVLRPDEKRYSKCPKMTVAECQAIALEHYPARIAIHDRWIAHYENRLAYERAMLDQDGGLAGQKSDLQVGGQVLVDGEWQVILRVNKAGGVVNSVTTTPPRVVHWRNDWNYGVEKIREYKPPTAEDTAKVKAATKLAPLCNYPGKDFLHITQAQWDARHKDYKGTTTLEATDQHARHRVRKGMFQGCKLTPVFITDAKRVDPPAADTPAPVAQTSESAVSQASKPAQPDPSPTRPTCITGSLADQTSSVRGAMYELADACGHTPEQVFEAFKAYGNSDLECPTMAEFKTNYRMLHAKPAAPDPKASAFEAMRQQLELGVQVVSAPQLFPTPPDLAQQMVDLAGITPGMDVLEPSAGTGAILDKCFHLNGEGWNGCPKAGRLVAVEINAKLADGLEAEYPKCEVICRDFLTANGEILKFDRILMNPPFERGSDIKHIQHARTFLKPGGRLVAICANGPRQQEQLKPLASQWIDLPAGTFKDAGTNVNTALLVIDHTH